MHGEPVSARGGAQRIPRPASARPGGPPAWTALPHERRRFTVDEVRAAAQTVPVIRLPPAPPSARPAAVLLPFFEEGGEARVILTKRPETMPSHQGEIAFPGGKLEEGVDGSLRDAALREAHEEIGLDPSDVDVVAELESMTTAAGRFVLTPFVGLLSARPRLAPDFTEVVSVFDVALSDLLDEAAYREERWDIPSEMGTEAGPDRQIHFFELPGETVWGATARILVRFLEHLTATRS
ncbi:MAG TPA: CoA pyrophosphatase [Acidimicrobiia bacterium]|nr:CoA pyrophosphatase [Acidimicrobiia bacterium]